MNATKSRLIFHLIAIVTVIIWGTTFVSTKILIQNGLTPSEIFFYRFVLLISVCGASPARSFLPIVSASCFRILLSASVV